MSSNIRRLSSVLCLLILMCLGASAEARPRKSYLYQHYGYDDGYSRHYRDVRRYSRPSEDSRHDDDDGARGRAEVRRGPFAAVLGELIGSCSRQAAELRKWPFDSISQIVRPDEAQARALEELRGNAAATADRLGSECPNAASAELVERLDAAEHGMATAIAAVDAVRPPLAAFYGALDDEQKARLLLRGPIAIEAQAHSAPRGRRQISADGMRELGASPTGSVCEQLAAALRDWPIRRIEREVRLSDGQRVALYELVTASLKAADALACPGETALTPVGRLDIMRARLSAVRTAIGSIRPALLHFNEALDHAQQRRFAQM